MGAHLGDELLLHSRAVLLLLCLGGRQPAAALQSRPVPLPERLQPLRGQRRAGPGCLLLLLRPPLLDLSQLLQAASCASVP